MSDKANIVGSIQDSRCGYDFISDSSSVRIINRATGLCWVATFGDLLPLAIAAGIDGPRPEQEKSTADQTTSKRIYPAAW